MLFLRQTRHYCKGMLRAKINFPLITSVLFLFLNTDFDCKQSALENLHPPEHYLVEKVCLFPDESLNNINSSPLKSWLLFDLTLFYFCAQPMSNLSEHYKPPQCTGERTCEFKLRPQKGQSGFHFRQIGASTLKKLESPMRQMLDKNVNYF